MNESYEFQGKTVDDAIAEGLIKLGLSREQVDIEVIHKGSRGIFGLGSEPAVVRIAGRSTPAAEGSRPSVSTESASPANDDVQQGSRSADAPQAAVQSEPANMAQPTASQDVLVGTDATDEELDDEWEDDFEDDLADEDEWDDLTDEGLLALSQDLLDKMVSLMGYDADVMASWQEPEPGEHERCLMLDVQGDGLSPLIGRRGDTLSNIQFLLRLMINQKTHAWYNIVVDVAGYKKRRAEQLTQLAMRVADQVAETGRSASLEPMPASERRIVHMALREHPDVYTQSAGEGERRKVHIAPKN